MLEESDPAARRSDLRRAAPHRWPTAEAARDFPDQVVDDLELRRAAEIP